MCFRGFGVARTTTCVVQSGYSSSFTRTGPVASLSRSTSRSARAMTFLTRLRVLPAVLATAAALATVGTSLFGDVRPGAVPPTPANPARPDGSDLVEGLAVTKFSKLPALTYQLRDG